ncbi:MAG: hypothetical protein M3144_09180 [Actinomycetota bacterium]|nr:hypothetical protein [Actinomycetota bacterium]
MGRVAELESSLRATEANNRLLKSRIAELQQARTEQVAAPPGPNNEWLAGVADRSAHALRSSQEAARRLVERARRRAHEIEQAALHDAADIRKRAEAEAQRILTVANYDAEGLLQGAQASSEELLAHAKRMRDRAMAQFAERRAALQEEIDRLEARRVGLLETFASLKTSVDEAIEALEPPPAERPPRQRPAAGTPRRRAAALLEWLRAEVGDVRSTGDRS